MRFLVDESTGPAVAAWLAQRGHEVCSVYDETRGADDESIIERAFAERWILITNDKGFGEKVIRERRPHQGVILLRLEDERPAAKIEIMERLLAQHGDRLAGQYVVVTERRVRFTAT